MSTLPQAIRAQFQAPEVLQDNLPSCRVQEAGEDPMTVEEFLQKECRRRKVYLWGQPHMVTPRLVSWIHGDGKQVIYFTPLATRPNYYVVRIDSKLDVTDRDHFHENVLDDLYGELEEQFGSSYEEWESDKNGRTYTRHNHWPALNYSCGSAWGQIYIEGKQEAR